MAELAGLTATELVAGYRDGSFTPVEATRDVLDVIDAHDPDVNAFVMVDRETALAEAGRSSQRWA